jgi:hypothetical protein
MRLSRVVLINFILKHCLHSKQNDKEKHDIIWPTAISTYLYIHDSVSPVIELVFYSHSLFQIISFVSC